MRIRKLCNALAGICGAVIVLTILVACASADYRKEIYWKEQVRLSTGEMILVDRGERRRRAGEGFSNGWLFDDAWLEANLPGVGKARWEGALLPLVLDVTARGEWYLLGVTQSSRGEKDYRLPEHKRYVAFKLSQSLWERIPFAQFPDSFSPNLLANTGRLFVIEGARNGVFVDFEMKQRVDSLPTVGKHYKRIDRTLGE